MSELADLRAEAAEALEQVWFIQSLEEGERTDITLSLRFHIRRDLFVQVFFGAKSASLYLALIEGGRRVFGIDREAGDWHVHPYEAEEKHEPVPWPKPRTAAGRRSCIRISPVSGRLCGRRSRAKSPCFRT